MDEPTPTHLEVRRLGDPAYTSPLALGTVPEDGRADFVDDRTRIVLELDRNRLHRHFEQGEDPPSLEAAGPRQRIFFRPNDVRAAVVSSGGLCPGINDVVRSVVMTLHYHYRVESITGIRYGLRGFVAEDAPPIPLRPDEIKPIHMHGGSLLGSSRGSPEMDDIVRYLDRNAISVLFMIGGDGTQKAVEQIAKATRDAGLAVAVVGIPKTIDNDILYVDQTFGFSTAVSLARESLHAAHAEATGAYNGVGLVRLMGRASGFIAAEAALASEEANFVLVPEVPFQLEGPNGVLSHLHRRLVSRRHALVVVAEGAGQDYLKSDTEQRYDASGNPILGDIGRYLRSRIEEYFGGRDLPVTVKYIDPGYTIRSAPANASDATYCQRLGQNAVHAAMAGRTEMMVGRVHGHQVHVPIQNVTTGRKRLNPEHPLWRAVLQSTGQPAEMVNR